MICEERERELQSLFWSETNEAWTQEWRECLTPEEAAMVGEWNERVRSGMLRMCRDILKLNELHRRKEN